MLLSGVEPAAHCDPRGAIMAPRMRLARERFVHPLRSDLERALPATTRQRHVGAQVFEAGAT